MDLFSGGLEDDVACVDGGVGVEFCGVGFGFGDAGDSFAGSTEVEDDGVFVCGVLWGFTGFGFYGVSDCEEGEGKWRGGALRNHCIPDRARLSPVSGIRPRRCERTSSWMMEVLVWT